MSLVELVSESGLAVGTAPVDVAHQPPGQLHRAFSVLLLDESARLLLQRRAAVKTRFALRWANTCCGHPRPGEPIVAAAARRLAEEMGVTSVPLSEVGVYVYRAADPDSGRVEHEYDHVLVGRLSAAAPFVYDPAEVAAVEWVATGMLRLDVELHPERYAPWLAGVLDVAGA
jgi:isopentenyl-diphosphate delta-isomerase